MQAGARSVAPRPTLPAPPARRHRRHHAPLPAAATRSAPAARVRLAHASVSGSGVAAAIGYPRDMEITWAPSCGAGTQVAVAAAGAGWSRGVGTPLKACAPAQGRRGAQGVAQHAAQQAQAGARACAHLQAKVDTQRDTAEVAATPRAVGGGGRFIEDAADEQGSLWGGQWDAWSVGWAARVGCQQASVAPIAALHSASRRAARQPAARAAAARRQLTP